MTHPPHPPSEMVEKIREELIKAGWGLDWPSYEPLIRNVITLVFAHVDRAAMARAIYEMIKHGDDAHRDWLQGKVDDATDAALAAALPGDA